jgi:heme exporter protein B
LTVVLYALLINGFVIRRTVFAAVIARGASGCGVIIAAIIARANTKGTLYPVLSFPILLPLLMTVIKATRMASEGASWSDAGGEFQILVSYIVVVITTSYLLFEYIWKD